MLCVNEQYPGGVAGSIKAISSKHRNLEFHGDTREHVCAPACRAVSAVHLISKHKKVKKVLMAHHCL